MRYMLLIAAATAILSTSAITASADTMANCAASWKAMSKADQGKTTYKAYSTSCMKGGAAAPAAKPAAAAVAAPAAPAKSAAMAGPAPAKSAAMAGPAPKAAVTPVSTGAAPAGATGACKDGTFTMSKTHSGACSKHGGVAKWL
jgi:hypothetical protein